jgi:hypothetical protein
VKIEEGITTRWEELKTKATLSKERRDHTRQKNEVIARNMQDQFK